MLSVFKAALIILIVAFGLWMYEHEFDNQPVIRGLDVMLGYLGGLVLLVSIVGGISGFFMGKTAKWRLKTRCIRCGEKIGKNEMYCSKHKKEVAEEYLRGTDPRGFFE